MSGENIASMRSQKHEPESILRRPHWVHRLDLLYLVKIHAVLVTVGTGIAGTY
jgi:hypothetical protein